MIVRAACSADTVLARRLRATTGGDGLLLGGHAASELVRVKLRDRGLFVARGDRRLRLSRLLGGGTSCFFCRGCFLPTRELQHRPGLGQRLGELANMGVAVQRRRGDAQALAAARHGRAVLQRPLW